MPSFIRSSRLVPPARKRPCGCPARSLTASVLEAARWYSNSFMIVFLFCGCEAGSEAPGLCGLAAGLHLADGRDDLWIGCAAADVAAHAFADLIVGEFRGRLREVAGDETCLAAFRLV